MALSMAGVALAGKVWGSPCDARAPAVSVIAFVSFAPIHCGRAGPGDDAGAIPCLRSGVTRASARPDGSMAPTAPMRA